MRDSAGRGFPRADLSVRYDVGRFEEDPWHAYAGTRTITILEKSLRTRPDKSPYLLNAGSSFYSIKTDNWTEVSIDLFHKPLLDKNLSACANIESMPFANGSFGAAVCVGEVLAYCDPAKTIREFSRILEPGGQLIIDFGSSTGLKYKNTRHFGRSADIVVDPYNGSEENIWVYNPSYIKYLLEDFRFRIVNCFGTHGISSLVRKFGVNPPLAISFERHLKFLPFPARLSEIVTFVAFQEKFLK